MISPTSPRWTAIRADCKEGGRFDAMEMSVGVSPHRLRHGRPLAQAERRASPALQPERGSNQTMGRSGMEGAWPVERVPDEVCGPPHLDFGFGPHAPPPHDGACRFASPLRGPPGAPPDGRRFSMA